MLDFRKKLENKEYCWFTSSNILHSETDLKGKDVILSESEIPGLMGKAVDVKIVFNRGDSYIYYNVPIHDYMAFVEHLNRSDAESSGKAFNKFIKPYPFDKLKIVDLNKLKELKNALQKEEKEDRKDPLGSCLNLMINGNVTDEYLIERFGKEVFDSAREMEIKNS